MPLSTVLVIAAVLGLASCATGPHARIVAAQFTCDDGRKLPVAFNLDTAVATLRLSRKQSVELARTGSPASRDYAGQGYRLAGAGDRVEFTAPDAPPVRCVETR